MLWGGKKGFQKPELLKDKAGDIMHTGRYWDPVARKHTSGKGPGERAYSALPLDWDGDGDLDLIVGTNGGGLYMRVNQGSKKQPAFATKLVQLKAGRKDAKVPGGYAMPVAADWDGDGRWDLISGSQDGAVYWFRNVGKRSKPKLRKPKQLISGAKQGKQGPERRSQVAVADFDGDGDMDLLVGDYNYKTADGKRVRHGWIWLYRRAGQPKIKTDVQPASASREESAKK